VSYLVQVELLQVGEAAEGADVIHRHSKHLKLLQATHHHHQQQQQQSGN
jgi:hypothetical protein